MCAWISCGETAVIGQPVFVNTAGHLRAVSVECGRADGSR
jgi:hypothetical protein